MASFIFTFLAIVVALAAGGAGGYMYRKNVQEKKIGRNEEFARNLLDEAQKRAEEKKKESILEAKEEAVSYTHLDVYKSQGYNLPNKKSVTIGKSIAFQEGFAIIWKSHKEKPPS